MRILFIILITIVMSGCTTYSIEKVSKDGTSTIVHVKSTRDMEQPTVDYVREGADAEFHFSAASVDNNSDMFASMMMQMLQMMQSMATPPVVTQ